jgi:hypothetical protein
MFAYIKTVSLLISLSRKEDKIAAITAKSPAGSFILIPPAIFTKTSYWLLYRLSYAGMCLKLYQKKFNFQYKK